MKVLLSHKRENIQRSGAGLESRGKTALARSNGQNFAERGHSKTKTAVYTIHSFTQYSE
jgi:hypothetical protein